MCMKYYVACLPDAWNLLQACVLPYIYLFDLQVLHGKLSH